MKIRLTERQLRQIIREELGQEPKVTNFKFLKIVDVEFVHNEYLYPLGLFEIETNTGGSFGVVLTLKDSLTIDGVYNTNSLKGEEVVTAETDLADSIMQKTIPDEFEWEWLDLTMSALQNPQYQKQIDQFLNDALKALKEWADNYRDS